MFIKTRTLTLFSVTLAAVLLLAAAFSACESTLGFGDVIDFEPPVLTFAPETIPLYVKNSTVLRGSVTDNLSINRVILRAAADNEKAGIKAGATLFIATLIGGSPKEKDWEIALYFDDNLNGEKLAIEIVAFDNGPNNGNSGEQSISALSLIIDTTPPIANDHFIERTSTRIALLEPLDDLKALETSDPNGERSVNADKYQNGRFILKAGLDENETRIDEVKLRIYDVGRTPTPDPDTDFLLEMDVDKNVVTSLFSPQWIIEEYGPQGIITTGQKKWSDYETRYQGGERYYYLVSIVAVDRSKNKIPEPIGYFCLWYNSDYPKGVLDPETTKNYHPEINPEAVVLASRGESLAVEFFDDDALVWAYTEMLTEEQWNGTADLNTSNLKILNGVAGNDKAKLDWLKDQLRADVPIYNWRYAKYGETTSLGKSNQITEVLNLNPGKTLTNKDWLVQTGNTELDYGFFVLFTIAGDSKTDCESHDSRDPESWGKHWRIQVIDSNAPLIVFDTVDLADHDYPAEEPDVKAQTGNSPEENTFPILKEGRYFEINGYTLRENGNGNNSVTKFRLAWIPYGMPTGPDNYIKRVQAALRSDDFSDPDLDGVQYWDLYESMIEGKPQPVNNIDFRKQVFRKTFDVLGGNAANTTAGIALANYKDPGANPVVLKNEAGKIDNVPIDEAHFVYNGKLENETKLFIFYAEDNMGHEVFRQLRLLGKKTPPDLAIYDISDRINDTAMPTTPSAIPNVGESPYLGNETSPLYIAALRAYNQRPAVYTLLKNSTVSPALTDANKTIPFQIYTRDTILKYWVTANKSGDLNVQSITMKDITINDEAAAIEVGSGYNSTDGALTYVELFPDEATRVFLFTAMDTLGNPAQIQRTVAITNTARLESITTISGNGTYGIDKVITLQANFSGHIRLEGGLPELNVRYQFNGNETTALAGRTYTRTGNYIYESIKCEPLVGSALFLEFKFKVPEGAIYNNNNDAYRLLTMYDGGSLGGVETAGNPPVIRHTDRPIRLLGGVKIIDDLRSVDAFVPGYQTGSTSMPKWITDKGSLQASKNIYLDGARPVITTVTAGGKTAYTTNQYYFKTGETILLTLSTAANGKNIRASATAPRLQYYIRENPPNGTTLHGPYTAFTFLRPSGSRALVFSLEVNTTNCPSPFDGELVNVTLDTGAGAGTIEDEVGNSIASVSNLLTLLSPAPSGTNAGTRIYIKQTIPAAPNSTLAATGTANVTFPPPNALQLYNMRPTLTIADSTAPLAAWETVKRYSLDGGLTWTTYPTAGVQIQPKADSYDLRTRYEDRAGNEGTQAQQNIQVNDTFPKLIAVTPVQPNGWHTSGTLQFDLNFADQVRAATAGNQISITLKNRATANNSDTDTAASTATARATLANTTLSSTIRVSFQVDVVNNLKEMRDGLYVSAVDFTNLRDRFGNEGRTWSGTWTGAAGTGTAPVIAHGLAPNASTCPNLGAGLRVDAIVPNVTERTPAIGGVSSYPNNLPNAPPNDTDKRNRITLTFREPVQKGTGTITIKPRNNFLIPPVFEDNGYYMDCVSEAKPTPNVSSNRTIWIPGFYDIYNDNALIAGDRNKLTESTPEDRQRATPSSSSIPSDTTDNLNPSMTRLRLDTRTGQPVGPYVKTTHGLKEGYGYSGLYNGGSDANNTNSESAATAFFRNGPNTDGSASGYNNGMPALNAMIPDTATKWVLAYQYSIHNAAGSQETPERTANGYGKASVDTTVVPDIRDVLVKTKFRWQEIDVALGTVTINGSTVTIILNEPLLKGLEWELSYPAGTFTDLAGNFAAAQAENNYIFWSAGVQKPVIRVNRKSYDARTSNWHVPRGNDDDTSSYTYAAPAAETGWGITDFDTIDYRIESETPGAGINYAVSDLRNSTYPTVTNPTTAQNVAFNAVSVTGTNWTGAVPNVYAVANQYTAVNWDRNNLQQARSFWVRPNLIRRDGYSGQGDADTATVRCRYYVNGELRYSAGTLSMFRSYNRDATLTTSNGVPGLNTLTLTSGTTNAGWFKGTVAFGTLLDGNLEAGKRYIVAEATRTGQTASLNGYEGVFRTLIVLNGQTGGGRTNTTNGVGLSRGKILVEGSNIKAGLPSVAGFPVQDGSDTGDNRFAKMMYNVDSTTPNGNINANDANNRRFYWVSTEIVCEWYFVYFGNGGRYMRTGDVNNYMMVGYGDLTYGYSIHRFPD
jgi:hypothetical protein